MERSRGVSALGAALILLFVVLETYNLLYGIYLAEVSVFSNSDFRWNVSRSFLLLILVGVASTARIVVLKNDVSYYLRSFSWFATFAMTLLYLWMVHPEPPPMPECGGAKICFGIYEMSNAPDWVERCAVVMPIVSFVRSAITAALASGASEYK